MELTIEQALQQGIAAHKEGELQNAERLYRAILRSQPAHPDANHNLGLIAVSENNAEAAVTLFKAALDANVKVEQFWLSYIDALIKAKQIDHAMQVLADAQQAGIAEDKLWMIEKKLQSDSSPGTDTCQPEFGGHLQSQQNEMSPAVELREVGKYKEAKEWLFKFVQHNPTNPEALSLLSQVLMLDKKETEAETALTAAVSIDSELPSIYRNQARLLLMQSKNTEALEKAQLGCKQSPEDLESSLVLAMCLGANQRDLEALPIIEKVIKARPNYAEAYANRALIKLRSNDPVGAIEDAKITVSIKPHLTQMWQLLGSLYYQSGNLIGAIEAIRVAHKNEPRTPAILIQLGEFLRQGNKVNEAIDILEKATELDPKNADAWTNLGVALQQQTRIADAKRAYERALDLNSQSAAISSNLGAMARDAGEWESALTYFEKAIEVEPHFAEAHSNLGVALRALGRIEESEASFIKAITLKPNYAVAHSNLGNTLKELGRLDEAEASHNRAIALTPNLAEAHYNLGVTLTELGELDQAVASCNRAIALKPDYPEALSHLGGTFKALGRLKEAEASYTQAIALKPDCAEAHSSVGATFMALGKLDKAEASYIEAIALKPDYAEAHNNFGCLLEELGRLQEAEASYRQAIAWEPHYAEAHSNLGNTLREVGRLDEAEASYADAVALKPDLAETHYNLGITLKELGRLDEAASSYTQAIALKPDYAEAYSNLGNTLKALGRLDESIDLYTKALAIQPDNAKFLLNLSAAKWKAIPSWHIPMMNERGRNEAYQRAIRAAIRGGDVVLDIGTGAGLLSMIAADCGAKEVITCEMSATISKIAEKVIQKNGFDHKIKVINKNSKDLILGQDIRSRADILVSEILSSEFVGEGIQRTLLDAKKRLLNTSGRMVPEGGSIMIALIENTGKLAEEIFVDRALGYDISDFNSITTNKLAITLEDEPVFLSEPIEAFTFDFCNFEKIYEDTKNIKIEVNKAGVCAGVIQWLKVNLYDDIQYQNNPIEMYRLNSVSGWKTPIFRFDDPVNIMEGESLNILATLTEDYSWFNLDRS